MRIAAGAIKLHIPGQAFLECAKQKSPGNTLFPDVRPDQVNFADLQRYLPLVLALYDLSPEGCFACNYRKALT